jgi:hypothetical protein
MQGRTRSSPRARGLAALALAIGALAATRRARAETAEPPILPSVPSESSGARTAIAGVVESPMGEPLAGVELVVERADGGVVARATSDAKGAFRVAPPADASGLTLRASTPGLLPWSAPLPAAGFVRVTLRAPDDDDGVRAIEVRGERRAPSSEESARPTRYALEASLLTRLPGTRGDPFAAVASLPSMARPPSLSTVYVVRGAAPEESVTYVDGAPMPHAFHFGGIVSILPPQLIESISLAPGGFGVAFGRATAGLVDVRLGALPTGVHATGALDAIDVGAFGSAQLGERTRVAIGARRSHVDAWIGSFVGDRVSGELPRYLDGQLVIEHDLAKDARLRVGLFAADDQVKVTDPTIPEDEPRTGSWASTFVRAHARLDAKLDDAVTLMAVASYTRSDDQIIGDKDEWGDTRDLFFGRVELEARLGDGPRAPRFSAGADFQATRIEGRRVLSIPASAFGGSAVFAMRGVLHVERVEPAAYAQVIVPLGDGAQITSGVRVDRAPLGEILVQPRAALRVEAGARTVLRATAGLYARPNVLDAASARDFMGAYLPVPVQAGPARGVQASLGVEHQLAKDVRLELDAWARTGHHALVPREQPAVPIYGDRLGSQGPVVDGWEYPLYAETGRLRAKGLEVMLAFGDPKATSGWVGFVGYALSRSEIQDDPYSPWRRMPLDQTHVLNAAAIWRLGRGWEAGARFRLAVGVQDSPYPASQIAPKTNSSIDPSRALPTLAPIHSLDLRLEKTFTVGKAGSASIYVEARNAYDRRAREPLAYNPVYQYAVVGEGLPIIPNLGVRGGF